MLLRREPARDNDELIRYLLGELADERAETLDERSVVEDDFAERLRLVEDDLVDAYASGRLSGERRARFETFYLTSPRRRERAAFAKRLLEAVDQEARRVSEATGAGRTGRWLPWALAAAVVLCVAAGFLLVRDARLENALTAAQHRLMAADRQATALAAQLAAQQQATQTAQATLAQARAPQPEMAVALVLMPQTRGVGPVPIVSVGSESRRVPIELAVDAPDRSPFEAALRDPATNAIVWRSGPLALVDVRPVPVVVVDLPASLLKAQHYSVDVVARRAGGTAFVGSYAFEVVRR